MSKVVINTYSDNSSSDSASKKEEELGLQSQTY